MKQRLAILNVMEKKKIKKEYLLMKFEKLERNNIMKL